MKKTICFIPWVFGLVISSLLVSCSDDSNDTNPVYDLRTLSQRLEQLDATRSPETDGVIRTPHKRHFRHVFMQNQQAAAPEVRGLPADTSDNDRTYAYEYNGNARLYWTGATGKDSGGNIVATASQTLDDAGFPVRGMWYKGSGNFDVAYDYGYDRTLYLRTSLICYLDNPNDDPNPRRDYENSSTWNSSGILTSRTGVDYDENGAKVSEYKWRSTTIKNALRGAGGLGYDEYYREYKQGI